MIVTFFLLRGKVGFKMGFDDSNILSAERESRAQNGV